MNDISRFLDPVLIVPYRLPEGTLSGFFFGTLCLVLLCLAVGEVSLRIVTRLNRRRLEELRNDMERHHKLSETALRMGDKASYKAVNSQAHDAFGHYFSFGAALFCVSIWPLPFAMGWMSDRFSGVTPILPWDVPIIGAQPTVTFWFLLLYIPIRIAYAKGSGFFARRKQRATTAAAASLMAGDTGKATGAATNTTRHEDERF